MLEEVTCGSDMTRFGVKLPSWRSLTLHFVYIVLSRVVQSYSTEQIVYSLLSKLNRVVFKFTLDQNHLEDSLNNRWLGATYRVPDSLDAENNLDFNKFPNNVNVTGSGITLQDSHVVDTIGWLLTLITNNLAMRTMNLFRYTNSKKMI